MFKTKSFLMAAIATLFTGAIAGSAMAADNLPTQAQTYAGINFAAQAKYDLSCLGTTSCDTKAKSSGKIYAGYLAAPTLFEGVNVSQGAELMYYKVGSAVATYPASLSNSSSETLLRSTDGLAASYVLQANFNDFSLNGRAGIAYTRNKVTSSLAGNSTTDKAFIVPVFGLGIRYAVAKNISLNADYDRLPNKFGSDKGVINMLSLGVGYKF
ncbi:porin family protein [Undibacterium sp. Jales W-56]|uniref:outer membrane protein n=1 Tax=Undibacterium sp. Jales W-56 TaxID=2897325 RepID=UPI0021CEF03C|nr:porin family protein [Undibacterium sp. Jales W-56]MCU6432420.1 porin family protein [Undibacterium sp. Jales W-56]